MTLEFRTDVVQRYRKKPEEVRAIQYVQGTDWEDLQRFTNYLIRMVDDQVLVYSREDDEWFELDRSDFLVKSSDGDLYPYDNEAFSRDFELVPTYTATTNLLYYPQR